MDVYVGLGGNIGDSKALVQRALHLINEHPKIMGLRSSSLYRSRAVSPEPQRDFVNAVCFFTTTLAPLELLHYLQSIEKKLGKSPKAKTAPRPIDLDILLYGTETVRLPKLQIPHPAWLERPFVLLPMTELVATLEVPGPMGLATLNLKTTLATLEAVHGPAEVWLLDPNERIESWNP